MRDLVSDSHAVQTGDHREQVLQRRLAITRLKRLAQLFELQPVRRRQKLAGPLMIGHGLGFALRGV